MSLQHWAKSPASTNQRSAPRTRGPLRGNKKPAHRRTSAAGKCLIEMDLPLAASEPSPPDSSGPCLDLQRLHRRIQPMNQVWSKMRSAAFGARLEFVARAHRKDPCIFVTIFGPKRIDKLRVS